MSFRNPAIVKPRKITAETKASMLTQANVKKRKLSSRAEEILQKPDLVEEPHKKFASYARNTFQRMRGWYPPLKTTNIPIIAKVLNKEVYSSEKKPHDESLSLNFGQTVCKKTELENRDEPKELKIGSESRENQPHLKLIGVEDEKICDDSLKEINNRQDLCYTDEDNQFQIGGELVTSMNCEETGVSSAAFEEEKCQNSSRASETEEIHSQSYRLKLDCGQRQNIRVSLNPSPQIPGSLKAAEDTKELTDKIDKFPEITTSTEKSVTGNFNNFFGKNDNASKKFGSSQDAGLPYNFFKTEILPAPQKELYQSVLENGGLKNAMNQAALIGNSKYADKVEQLIEKTKTVPEMMNDIKKSSEDELKNSGRKNSNIGKDVSLPQNTELSNDVFKNEKISKNEEQHQSVLENRGLETAISQDHFTGFIKNTDKEEGTIHCGNKLQTNENELSEVISSDDDLDNIVSKTIDKYMKEEKLAQELREKILNFEMTESSQETVIVSPARLKAKGSSKRQHCENSCEGKETSRDAKLLEDKALVQRRNDEMNDSLALDGDETVVLESSFCTQLANFNQNSNQAYDQKIDSFKTERHRLEKIARNTFSEEKGSAEFTTGKRPLIGSSSQEVHTSQNYTQQNTMRDTIMNKTRTAEHDLAMANQGDTVRNSEEEAKEINSKTDDYMIEFQNDIEADLFLQVEDKVLLATSSQLKPLETLGNYWHKNLSQAGRSRKEPDTCLKNSCLSDRKLNFVLPDNFCTAEKDDFVERETFIDELIPNESSQQRFRTLSENTSIQTTKNITCKKPDLLRNPIGISILATDRPNIENEIEEKPGLNQSGKTTEKFFRTFSDLYENGCLSNGGFYFTSKKFGRNFKDNSFPKEDTAPIEFKKTQTKNHYHQDHLEKVSFPRASEDTLPPTEHFPSQSFDSIQKVKASKYDQKKMRDKLIVLKGFLDQYKKQRERKMDQIRNLLFETNISVYNLIDSLEAKNTDEASEKRSHSFHDFMTPH